MTGIKTQALECGSTELSIPSFLDARPRRVCELTVEAGRVTGDDHA